MKHQWLCKLIIISLVSFTLAFAGCSAAQGEGFAIYLTSDDISPAEMPSLNEVILADQPFIGVEDIVSYNQQTYELKLTESAFTRISQLEVSTSGKPFVVCVDKQPVYTGAFWTFFSSQSFDGITIMLPYNQAKPFIVTINKGYPSDSFFTGTDPRNSQIITAALRRAGKLITALGIEDIDSLPSSMKGYELYSWQEKSKWHFTLITGTNRNKTAEEIISAESYISETGWVNIHCTGLAELKAAIGKVPAGEWLIWCDSGFVPDGENLVLPPQEIIAEIEQFAADKGLEILR